MSRRIVGGLMNHPYLAVACVTLLVIGAGLVIVNVLARIILYWLFFK